MVLPFLDQDSGLSNIVHRHPMYTIRHKTPPCPILDNPGRTRAGGLGLTLPVFVCAFRVGWLEGGSEGANWQTPPLSGEESASSPFAPSVGFSQPGRRSVASVGHRSPANLSPPFPVGETGGQRAQAVLYHVAAQIACYSRSLPPAPLSVLRDTGGHIFIPSTLWGTPDHRTGDRLRAGRQRRLPLSLCERG